MILRDMKEKLNGGFAETFSLLYGTAAAAEQNERYKNALGNFQNYFGVSDDAEVSIYSAPGRTEIGGNHTDHQNGIVLAASVGLDIIAVVMKTDGEIRIKSEGYEEERIDSGSFEPVESEKNTMPSLIRGVAAKLSKDGFKTGGFCAYLTSTVLKGSGLSSSAAFETLMGTIFNYEYNGGRITAVAVAQAGQYAENNFFGKPSGLMDQAACSVGGLISIDFRDPREPKIRKIKMDLEKAEHTLYVVDTGGNHANLTPDYAAIPIEMKQIANAMGAEVLREVDEEKFFGRISELRNGFGDRAVIRAIHFFEENKRSPLQAELLEQEDFEGFLRLVRESGISSFCYLQNVFSPARPAEQGISLGLAAAGRVLGERGAFRVHGGGFAGTILVFVPNDLREKFEAEMSSIFGANSCHKLFIRPVGPCKLEDKF